MTTSRLRTQTGLTLIELVVVIVVIGLLAAILVPAAIAALRASREARAIGNLKSIGNAQMSFYSTNGRFGFFEELFEEGYLGQQFARGRQGGPTEVVADGNYRYSFRFSLNAAGITADADPERYRAPTHRWFRYRLGRVAASGVAGSESLILAAPPSRSPPATSAYKPLR